VSTKSSPCTSSMRRVPLANRTWQWRCPPLPVPDPRALCLRLRGNILIVGDSVSHVFAQTLAALQGGQRLQDTPSRAEWSVCGGRRRLTYVRNDVLDVAASYGGALTSGRGFNCYMRAPPLSFGAGGPTPLAVRAALQNKGGNPALCNPWSSDLRGADLAVLNSGAHGLPDDVYAAFMRAAAAHARGHAPNGTVLVWRNTPAGTPGCAATKTAAPLPTLQAAKVHIAALGWAFDWDQFARRNAIAARVFLAQGFAVADAYTGTAMRLDGHPHDCLHYCMPGPVLHWVLLVLGAFAARRGGLQSEVGAAPVKRPATIAHTKHKGKQKA